MFRFLRLFEAFPNLHILTDIIVIRKINIERVMTLNPWSNMSMKLCDTDTVLMVDLATSELLLSIQSAFRSYFIKR